MIEKLDIKNEIPSLNDDQIKKISGLISKRENKYISLILFLREQVTDNCCHAVLEEDECLDRIEKVLNI